MYNANLKVAVEALHGCLATHSSTTAVKEIYEGETAWVGNVEVFALTGHPLTDTAFAWAYQDDSGETRYVAVLKIPPVETPSDAVRAAIASGQIS